MQGTVLSAGQLLHRGAGGTRLQYLATQAASPGKCFPLGFILLSREKPSVAAGSLSPSPLATAKAAAFVHGCNLELCCLGREALPCERSLGLHERRPGWMVGLACVTLLR